MPDGCESDKIQTIPVMKQDMTAILLTGDLARNKVQVMPGGGYSTIKIDLPDDWDRLMAEKDMHRYPNTSILHIDTAKSDNGIGRFTFVWEMLLFLTNF